MSAGAGLLGVGACFDSRRTEAVTFPRVAQTAGPGKGSLNRYDKRWMRAN